jgi:uncharacterized protein
VDAGGLAGVDAVIHLAGANLGGRPWTPAYRRTVMESRVAGTRTIATAVAALPRPPRVLLSASGVGYYGNPGDTTLDESAPAGDTYIAEIARRWEESTAPAAEAGIRVVPMRTGVVVSGRGGALGRLLPIFRAGLGGRVGSGRQFWSWLALRDYVSAVRFLLDQSDIEGPVNVTSPQPVTNAEFTKAFGEALHRPAFLPIPAFGVKIVVGGVAELAVMSTRALPVVLNRAGYEFRYPDVRSALGAALT